MSMVLVHVFMEDFMNMAHHYTCRPFSREVMLNSQKLFLNKSLAILVNHEKLPGRLLFCVNEKKEKFTLVFVGAYPCGRPELGDHKGTPLRY